ncbi:MAG TPA: type II secretion system protein [Candidatus Saccharimonadales bacterium]|nr:type II secretion system protein [Candidatus Saccharimonadales bacterium]
MWVYKRQQGQPGFTIVELLIVIVVIAILAAITVVAYNGSQSRAKQARIQADLSSVQELVESYKVMNGTYPVTAASLNPDWGTNTARTDSNCSYGTKNADWVPGLNTTLPQSGTSKGVGNAPGCYMYVSDGTSYVISGWNMLDQPQNTTMYRRLGMRETDSWPSNQFYICNHTNLGGNGTGTYVIANDYYKRSYTLSNITSALCNETPPTGA